MANPYFTNLPQGRGFGFLQPQQGLLERIQPSLNFGPLAGQGFQPPRPGPGSGSGFAERLQSPLAKGLLGLGAGLLQSGGWSPVPISTGQALGAGLQQGLQSMDVARQRKLQEQELAAKQEPRLSPTEFMRDWEAAKQEPELMRAFEARYGVGGIKEIKQQLDLMRVQQDIERQRREAEKAGFEKTPLGRFQNLNTAEKTKVELSTSGLQAVKDMSDALAGGSAVFSIGRDNPFTEASRRWEEAIGRLRSQGAISTKEESRFVKMRPTLLDSDEVKESKLRNMQREMERTLGTIGFVAKDADVLGIDPSLFGKLSIKQEKGGSPWQKYQK